MKKILFLILLAPVFSKAQSNTAKIASEIDEIPRFLSRDNLPLLTQNQALIVIDGKICNILDQQISPCTSNNSKNPTTRIPYNIESVTTLSSVKSMALYGSKGINGAIVITTKRQVK